MLGPVFDVLQKECTLKKLSVDPSMQKMKVSGMTFDISAYELAGIGRVSLMCAKGFGGLMKMDTLVISSLEKDIPMFSYDRINAMGNQSIYMEIINTTLRTPDTSSLVAVSQSCPQLAPKDPGVHWYADLLLPGCTYKSFKKDGAAACDQLESDMLRTFLQLCKAAPACDPAEKSKANAQYVNGLLEKGGPATDPYIKKYGAEVTGKLFREVLFSV